MKKANIRTDNKSYIEKLRCYVCGKFVSFNNVIIDCISNSHFGPEIITNYCGKCFLDKEVV